MKNDILNELLNKIKTMNFQSDSYIEKEKIRIKKYYGKLSGLYSSGKLNDCVIPKYIEIKHDWYEVMQNIKDAVVNFAYKDFNEDYTYSDYKEELLYKLEEQFRSDYSFNSIEYIYKGIRNYMYGNNYKIYEDIEIKKIYININSIMEYADIHYISNEYKYTYKYIFNHIRNNLDEDLYKAIDNVLMMLYRATHKINLDISRESTLILDKLYDYSNKNNLI